MKITRRRIVDIIKEEIQKMYNSDTIAPVDLDPVAELKARYQEKTGVAMEHISDQDLIKYAAEQIQAYRRELNPLPDAPSQGEETETAPLPPEALKLYNKKMGIK